MSVAAAMLDCKATAESQAEDAAPAAEAIG